MSQHESSSNQENPEKAVKCSYNPPAQLNYPAYTFKSPTLGSGTVSVTLRAVISYNWREWTDRNRINLDASLEPLLNSFVNNMSYFSRVFGDEGYGDISWIGDLGGPPGGKPRRTYHNVGRALDIAWIQWVGGHTSKPQVAESEVFDSNRLWKPTTHRRLVAVEAGLRKWFGYVLNRYIGRPELDASLPRAEGPKSEHHNHFHADNACHVALRVVRSSLDTQKKPTTAANAQPRWIRSCNYFVQDCINAFTDERVSYDGQWDGETDHGYETLLSDLGMECLNPVQYVNHYMLFLDYIMMHGFANKPAGYFRWGDNALL